MPPSGCIPAFFFIFLLCCLKGTDSANVVTLDSFEFFRSHEWFPSKPTIYFHCQGEENKTVLPDVKETNVLYTFKGEESWQPLTELPDQKCKRCGFYEKDIIKSDDVFDEWELCPADFTDGKYVRFKENEFNSTFICPLCKSSVDKGQIQNTATRHHQGKAVLIAIVGALVSVIVIAGMVTSYGYWQKRKRQRDQIRFLKLFEEGDDFEDELGLEPVHY